MKPADIGSQLRERLDAKGWSQVAVAKATGVHQSQISRFCAGDFSRDGKNLRRVCSYADVPLDGPTTLDKAEELRALFDKLVASLSPPKRRILHGILQSILRSV